MIRALSLLCFFFSIAAAFAAAAESGESLALMAQDIARSELAVAGLKKDNQSRLEFFQPAKPAKTKWSFLYIHGFSASPRESSPLMENLAKEWQANAYFPRYQGHGIEGPDGLKSVTLESLEKETDEALSIARQLGEKVVVISMSTGSSFAIPALIKNPENIAAHIMLSPNFRLYRWDSVLLRLPFGEWIARLFLGEYHQWKAQNPQHDFYWTTRYPSSAAVIAVRAASKAKNAALESIKTPTFVAYSPKDTVVHVPSMLSAFEKLGASNKKILPLPEAEETHNISGDILSPATTKVLFRQISAFLGELGP